MNAGHFFASVVVVFGLTCITFVTRVNINSEITRFSEVLITDKNKRKVVLGERNHSKINERSDFCRLCTDYRRFKALIEPNNSATSYSNTVLNYGATSRLDVVFLIPSTNDDEAVRRRQAIRRTWANHTKHLPLATRHVFVLGMNANKSWLPLLSSEAKTYNDILLLDFVESYWNLCTKIILGFNWALKHCNTDIFVKIDDDIICNVSRIYREMLRHVRTKPQGQAKVIIGKCRSYTAVPDRNPNSPSYVSRKTYPGHMFPKTCMGPTYVVSREAVKSIITQVRVVPLLKQEDVTIGVLARSSGDVTLRDIPNWRRDVHRADDVKVEEIQRDLRSHYYSVHAWNADSIKMGVYLTQAYP